MRQLYIRYLSWLLIAWTLAVSFGSALVVAGSVTLPSDDEFNVLTWEFHHVPNKWLYLGGRLVRGQFSRQEENERVARYLALTASAARIQATNGDRDELKRVLDERRSLENDVEAIIEGRLTAVLEDAGLESSLPLFPDARWVFPPVDVEFDEPPLELAVSPRSRIDLIEHSPLRPDLDVGEASAVERRIERDGERSALVSRLAGAATYPSIVAGRSDYEELVQTVAHEWVHQYLAFKPLGQRFYSSVELRTLNETVADLAGQELGTLLVERFPLDEDNVSRPSEQPVDLAFFFGELRSEVDALLAAGRIEEAEALMARRRQELEDVGVYYRRINQAFFAFRSVYANAPGSIDPIGQKVECLRTESGSVGSFLRAASGLTGEPALDRALAAPSTAGVGTGRR